MKPALHKFCQSVIIIIILAGIFLGASYALKNALSNKISQRVNSTLAPLQWEFQIPQTFSPFSPTCLPLATLNDKKQNGTLKAKNICLTGGFLTLIGFNDTQKPHIQIEKLSGTLSTESILALRRHAEKISPTHTKTHTANSPLPAFNATFLSADITLGTPGQRIRLRTNNARATANTNEFSINANLSPSIDIKTAPFAIENLPAITLSANIQRKTKQGSISCAFVPNLQAVFLFHEKKIHLTTTEISAGYNYATSASIPLSAQMRQIQLRAPEILSHAALHIDAVKASFTPSLSTNSTTIQIDNPSLQTDIDEILSASWFQDNDSLRNIIGFWQQDAGAFLGEAPKNSVRRDNVKKNIPIVKKNPIPEETIQNMRRAFASVQTRLNALPEIAIHNGQLTLRHSDSAFSLSGIEINTRQLVQSKQGFELKFNKNDASASLTLVYPQNAILPEFHINIQKLAAQDFLKLLNLPIPQKNNGTVSINALLKMFEREIALQGDISLNDFAFFHEKISPNLIHDINLTLAFNAAYTFDSDTLKIAPITLKIGSIAASGFFSISDVRSSPLITFEISASDIPCHAIPALFPPGLFPTITNLELEGSTMSPKLSGTIPWKYPLTASLKESGFEDRCLPTKVDPYHPLDVMSPDYVLQTSYTYFANAIAVGPATPNYVKLDNIPPYVRAAMYLTEDKRFFEHGPLRIAFIERALRLNLNLRKYVYGGSTIGQQLTKNLFLNRTKNIARKLEEAFVTWYLVSYVPKSRLFELYINVIEFGPDIYGIYNAAKFYFDKSPADLTPLEGAYLAALKVSPAKGGRFYKQGFPKDGRWWNKRMKYILKVLAENGYISSSEVLAAYPWIPEFVYPDPQDKNDERNIWLENFTLYLKSQK